MANEIEKSDFGILVCTETYARGYSGREEKGRGPGAKWEDGLIRKLLYEAEGENDKFIAVVFSDEDRT